MDTAYQDDEITRLRLIEREVWRLMKKPTKGRKQVMNNITNFVLQMRPLIPPDERFLIKDEDIPNRPPFVKLAVVK